ncbi:MAG: head-tail connector protein [Pseudomonadota bacterium]|nr:head-tail connector protein [Pseudomonadota bacterium]
MSLIDLSKPAVPAVSLSTLKEHLRIDGSAEDTLLLSLLDAATKLVEAKGDTKLIQRQVRLSTAFKKNIMLPIGPLVSLDALDVRDTNGDLTSLNVADAIVDTDTGEVNLSQLDTGVLSAKQVRLTCTVGHGTQADDMPDDLAHAVLLQASHMYEARGLADAMLAHPMVETLCQPYQRPTLV